MTNVSLVARYGLCCGCGTCAGMCPSGAIDMVVTENGIYAPRVKEGKCTNCHLCIDTCPGHSVDFQNLNLEIFGRKPDNKNIGSFLECYVGHANNPEIRYNASSGGLATQLLIFALDNGYIDGALITRMAKDEPTKPQTCLVRTKEEIIAASKSKYCPVSANVGLRDILKEKGRFAVVGLPCHIHGVRKASRISKALNEKIVLYIGLLCSHMTSFVGMEFLLKKIGMKASDVVEINYRGRGWPGSMMIRTKEGSAKTIPLFGSWKAYWPIYSSFFFTPSRCTMCPDQAAELADVSLGDAWLPEFKNEKIGKSIIIARTDRGNDILKHAHAAKAISIRPVSPTKVEQSQAVNLIFKKKDLSNRLSFLASLGRETPKFTFEQDSRRSPASYLRTTFVYCGIKASASKQIESVLVRVPFPLFRIYYGIYKLLSCI